jgi:muramidase (phage lysozyme)
MSRLIGISANLSAFLQMIGWSEIGPDLLALSDDGYNVLVGSTPQNPLLFSDYSTHPDVYNPMFNSTAAGKFQIIHPTFVGLCQQYGYIDFEPATQDAMAVNLITGRRAMPFVEAGNFTQAVALCAPEWASLPGSLAGQPQQRLARLQAAYVAAGGTVT